MSRSDFILEGPPVGPIPDCSLGEYLVPKLRSHPADLVIQVDGDTGAEQTVGELLEMSIRLSEGLKKLGLKENDIVGMMCRNCFEASEIMLGTWLNGSAVSPVHGKMTVYEMQNYLEECKPKFLFCDEEAIDNATKASKLVSVPPSVIFVGNNMECQKSHRTFQEVLVETEVNNYTPQPVKSPSTQLVLIPRSSGTSGLPKNVALTHRNFIFQDFNMECLFPFNKRMVVLQISHFFWITGVMMFLKCLTNGAKRVLLRNATVENVLKAIDRYKTEWSLMAPLFALSIVQSQNFEKYDVSSMKTIVVGGSRLTENIAAIIREKWKNITIIQSYGTTEASGNVCSNITGENLLSIGKVTPGVQLKVVDETGKSLKANSQGEILIRSPGVMTGYLGNEAATREALDSEGWFHTGDLGYYDESGQVYLIARKKELIKILNMQVAPAEIESAILSIKGVKDVGVAGVTNDGISHELLALVVKDKNSTVSENDIHAHIENTLSDYKRITGGIYFVDNIPKTASGKLLRTELQNITQELYSKARKNCRT